MITTTTATPNIATTNMNEEPTSNSHSRSNSHDNSCCSDLSSELFSVEEEDMQKIVVDKTLMEPSIHKKHDVALEKPLYGFGEDEDDCTTVTLSTSTSEPSGNSGKSRLGGWAARFVRNKEQDAKLPMDNISPLSTPSPTNYASRKAFDQTQVADLPPLKQFGAQSSCQASLQMQSLEAIMAKQQEQQQILQRNNGNRWFWRNGQEAALEDESVADKSMASCKSNTSSSFRWGRFLGSSNDTIDSEEEEDLKALYSNTTPKKNWKNRFSFRPSQMDTMLDDMEDPYYLDSISLGSESSTSSFQSTTEDDEGVDENNADNNTKTHRRRWSRLWRAQEFSRDAPTIHMI